MVKYTEIIFKMITGLFCAVNMIIAGYMIGLQQVKQYLYGGSRTAFLIKILSVHFEQKSILHLDAVHSALFAEYLLVKCYK